MSNENVPAVTVVIAAFNAERFLGFTLQSLLAQTRPDWESIVVDDGSIDNTFAIATKYAEQDPRIRVISQVHSGISVARNLGISLSHPSGRYLCFLDSDDLWLENSFQNLINALDAHPEATAAYGLADCIDEEGDRCGEGALVERSRRRIGLRGKRLALLRPSEPMDFASMAAFSSIAPPGVALCRKSVVEACGLFDTAIEFAEDWDLLVRMSRQGPLHFIDQVVVLYRRHALSVTRDQKLMAKWVANVRLKTYLSEENTPYQRKLLSQTYRALQIYRVEEKWRILCAGRRAGNPRVVATQLASILVLTVRYAFGRPTRYG